MATFIDIPKASRYKDTPLYLGTRGSEFALLEPPVEATQEDTEYTVHRVRSHEVGFLDVIAARYYGFGNESLKWFLALSNAILDAEVDMFVGQELLIPSRDLAMQFRTRSTTLAV